MSHGGPLLEQYQCSNISSLLITGRKFEQIFTEREKPTVLTCFCQIPVQSAEAIFYGSMCPASRNIFSSLLSVNLNLSPCFQPQASTSSMWGLSDFLSLSFGHGENYYKWSKQFDHSQLLFIMHRSSSWLWFSGSL